MVHLKCRGGLKVTEQLTKGDGKASLTRKGKKTKRWLRSERCERPRSLKAIIGSGGKCTKIIEVGLHKYVTLCFIVYNLK